MTKYRIKDETIEKAVRGLFKTQEAYEEALNNSTQINEVARLISVLGPVSVTGIYCEVHVFVSDIEKVIEYDPNGWNKMSVKPPANGQYLVYCKSEKWFSIWRKDGDLWVNPTGFFRRYDNAILEHFKYRSFDSLKAGAEND